jgi:hypothetical protein
VRFLKETPDFGPHRSLTGNQNAIETRIGKISERLDKRLAASGATINKQDILDDLQAIVDNLAETSPCSCRGCWQGSTKNL